MKKYIFLIFLSIYISSSFAHPHIFIDADLTFVTYSDSLKFLEIQWKWDKWFSVEILDYCDINKNGQLEPDEVKKVYEDFFIGVKEFYFFTQIEINNKKLKINDVTHFNANTSKNSSGDTIVIYNFTVPVNKKIENNLLNFKIIKYDETIFTAFENAKLIIKSDNFKLTEIKNISYKFCGKQLSGKIINKE